MHTPVVDELVRPWYDFDSEFAPSDLDADLVIDQFDSWTLSDTYAPPCGPCWGETNDIGGR